MTSCLRRPRIWLIVLFLLPWCCYGLVKWQKYRNRQARLCPPSALCSIQDLPPKDRPTQVRAESVRPLCGQTLFFLGKGRQCSVYETGDGRFVLKLFKKASKESRKKAVLEAILGGVLAQNVIPDMTGVIACAYGPQSGAMPTVVLLTEKGRVVAINLQNVPFLVQHKALPLKKTLLQLIRGKHRAEAIAHLESLFVLLSTCRDRGIVDRDGSLIRNGNIGYIGGKAILMDTGKLSRLPDRKKITLHDINRLKPLVSWLEAASPDLVPVFKQLQQRYLDSCEKRKT